MTDGGYTMTEAWNLQLQAEITRLRADLTEAQRVVVAMRDALDAVDRNFTPATAMLIPEITHEALALTPDSLAGMVLVPVKILKEALRVVPQSEGFDAGPEHAREKLRAMSGDSHDPLCGRDTVTAYR